MSGLCALIDFEGGRVEESALRLMVAASGDRGPDGVATRVDEGFGAAHLSLQTTAEATRELQPILSPDGRLWLVADARIDNRDELIELLKGDECLRQQRAADADLILAAYRRWGEECPRMLLGDFAFALWDRQQRKLFCARDPIGVRPLVYGRRGRRFAAASSLDAVISGLGLAPDLNDELLQDFLAGRYERWVDETVYRSVLRLPPAHCLTVTPQRATLSRYWTLGGQPAVTYRSQDEYAEHFRELFESAVKVRLTSSGPVGILVSGGLDSSSIACTAHRLAEAGEISSSVRLYSCVFDRTPFADESEYLEAVLASCRRFPATRIPSDDGWGLREFGVDDGFPLEEPEISLDRFLWQRPLRHARSDGCRVVVEGTGGDQVAAASFYFMPDNLRDVPWPQVRRELSHFSRALGRPLWQLAAYRVLLQLAPWGLELRRALQRRRRALSGAGQWLGPPASPPTANHLPPPRLPGSSAALSYRALTKGSFSAAMVTLTLRAAAAGVERRYPFLDRRLIDFLLSVPPDLHFRRGRNRHLLRRAMCGILPEKVRQRTGNAHFSDLIARGLRERERARAEALLRDARIVRRGMVDPARLSAAWMCYLKGSDAKYRYQGLSQAFCLETWLRHFETGKHRSEEAGDSENGDFQIKGTAVER